MKYQTPELTVLTLAINAIQDPITKLGGPSADGVDREAVTAYVDWES